MLLNNIKPNSESNPALILGEDELILSHNELPFRSTKSEHIHITNTHSIAIPTTGIWNKLKIVWWVVKYIFTKKEPSNE